MKYVSIVPLIGGETIAMEKAFGTRPEFMLSYTPFANNDQHIVNYYKDVPYHVIDDGDGYEARKAVNETFKTGKHIDVVNTVCPCAGLSTLSPSSSADNPANDWMIKTTKYVLGNMKPTVFWGENAPGLATKMGKPVVDMLRKIALDEGYVMSIYKTQSRLHGLCQVRNRSFYFFWKGNHAPIFKYYDRPRVTYEDTVRSAATNRPDEMWETLANDSTPSDNPFYKYILQEIHGGIGHVEFQKTLESSTGVHEYIESHGRDYRSVGDWMSGQGFEREATKCYRMHDKLAAGGNIMRKNTEFGKGEIGAFVGHKLTHLVHPDVDRYLNLRECLTMMGLPSDFELVGGRKNINHIAQNVPVTTAMDMADEVGFFLSGASQTRETDYLFQDNLKKIVEFESSNDITAFFE